MPKTLIAIVGPTAIGKTKRAIALAKHFHTEIISADSRQFYKEMRIGTAVPTNRELKEAPHHFIQHLSVEDSYSVGDFERDAMALLEDLFTKNDIVILVGGSGLYVDAVLYGLDDFPEVDPDIRADLNALHKKKGLVALQDKLRDLDLEYHKKVDLGNPHRLIRALEICISTGKPYSSFLGQQQAKRNFQFKLIGIDADREVIYDRINQRVNLMIEMGLVGEAKALLPKKHLNALQTVGYKELFAHFEGHLSLEGAIAEVKKNTRRFAKRQLTWYRKNNHIFWLDHLLSDSDFLAEVDEQIRQISHA